MERHVVITGASGGIGKVVLKHLLENGYTVYAACRDSSRLKEFSDYMPDSLHPITLDMESLACVGKFCSEVIEKLSGCRIDMLINNAGVQFVLNTHVLELTSGVLIVFAVAADMFKNRKKA